MTYYSANSIKFIENKYKTDKDNDLLRLFSKQERDKVFKFHKSMGDSYNETDLVSLKSFAKGLGINTQSKLLSISSLQATRPDVSLAKISFPMPNLNP